MSSTISIKHPEPGAPARFRSARMFQHYWCTRAMLLIAVIVTAFHDLCGQGVVRFANHVPERQIVAPVFDVDGTTRIGSNYVAQLFVSPMETQYGEPRFMTPLGDPATFGFGASAGFWTPTNIAVAGIGPREQARFAVGVWSRQLGSSYPEAVAAYYEGKEGAWGSSLVFPIILGDDVQPAYLEGLSSFGVFEPLRPANMRMQVSLSHMTNRPPVLTLSWTSRWEGDIILQSAPLVSGPWSDIASNVVSPVDVAREQTNTFFRIYFWFN